MSVELKVPQLGESITEAVVGKWNKKVGEPVAVDEPVVVLETDKVTIDVQAPTAGVIEAIAYQTGAKVKIGDVLGAIVPGAAAAAPKPVAATAVGSVQSPSAAVIAAPQAAVAPPAPTPVARAVAADKGIDPSSVQGSGSNGRVMKDDVMKASAPVQTLKAPVGARAEERVPMTTLRKRVAERLLQAQNNAAILTTFNEVDMSEVMALRKTYNERFEKKHGIKLGFMSFFVKASIEALKAFPAVNGSIDGDDVVFHHYYDIGVAVSGSRGLVVPIIRDADHLNMAELEKAIAEYGTKARNDKLQLSDLQGGTFTLSNGGIFGSMLSTPILNPPQTGILGMHNIVDRPVVRDGQIVVRPIMYLALSYDHRLIDGREAVQFLVRIKECIEAPERMLLENLMLRWKPSALFGFVMTLPSIGFFALFGARIAPTFAKMFSDMGGNLPFATRIAVHPATAPIVMGVLISGLVAGALRPNERFLILPLLAASGFVMSLVAMVSMYLPVFTLADQIK